MLAIMDPRANKLYHFDALEKARGVARMSTRGMAVMGTGPR